MTARWSDRLLTLGAVAGTLVLLALLVAVLTGTRPVVLRSGSMEPTMPTGSLALARQVPAAQLRVGDVVMVRTGSGARVTHRVTALEQTGGTAVLTLRGDGNEHDDPTRYPVGSAYRVYAHVPYAGYLLGFLGGPLGLVLLGAGAVVVLRLLVRGDDAAPPGTSGGRRRAGARRRAAVGATVAMVVLGPAQPGAWAAPWTDDVAVGGTTLTAGTIAVPATFTCGGLGVLSVTFTWASVAGATSYTVHYGAGGSSTTTVAGTSITLVSAISGGTAWVVANRNFGATTWSSGPSVTRTYTVAVVSLCG